MAIWRHYKVRKISQLLRTVWGNRWCSGISLCLLCAHPYILSAQQIPAKELTAVSDSLASLGEECLDREDYPKALGFYLRCSEFEENNLGSDHYYYANTLAKIGLIYHYLGEYGRADDYLSRCYAIVKTAKGDSLRYYGDVLGELSAVYYTIGDSVNALRMAEEATVIYLLEMGELNSRYAFSLGWQAKAWFMYGEYDRALGLWWKSVDILEEIQHANREDYLSVYYSMATTFRDMDNPGQAFLYYDKIYELYPDLSQGGRFLQDVLTEACNFANEQGDFERTARYGIRADWIEMYLNRPRQDSCTDFSEENLLRAIDIISEESYYPDDVLFLRRLMVYIPDLGRLAELYGTRGNDRCYALSLKCMHKLVACIEKKAGKNSSGYVWGLSRYALRLLKTDQTTEARKLLKEALEIQEKIRKVHPTGAANELYLCVWTDYLSAVGETPEEYNRLDGEYERVYKDLKKLEGKVWTDSLKLAEICINMLGWCKNTGRSALAERLYTIPFDIYGGLCYNFHPLWVQVLGYTEILQQSDSTNLGLFKFQIEFNKAYYGEIHPATLQAYHNLTRWYANSAQGDLAICTVQKVWEISRNFFGDEHTLTISALAGVIDIYVAFAKYKEADEYQQKLLDLVAKVYGRNSCKYAFYLIYNSERLTRELGDKEGHAKILAEIQEILVEIESSSIEYAEVLSLVSQLYSGLSQRDKAVEYQKKALEIYATHWGENTDYAKQLQVLMNLLIQKGDLKEAEKTAKQYAGIIKKYLGEDSESYRIALVALADIQMQNGNLESGINNYEKIGETIKTVAGDTSASYGDYLAMLANGYRQMQQWDKARDLLEQSEKLTQSFLEVHIDNSAYYQIFVDFYIDVKEWDKAEEYAFKALQSSRLQYKGEDIVQYDLLKNIALIYMFKNQFDNAEKYITEAIQLMKKIRGEYSFDYLQALMDQLNFMRTIGVNSWKEMDVMQRMARVISYQYAMTEGNEVVEVYLKAKILPELASLFADLMINDNLERDPAFIENGGKQGNFYKNLIQVIDQMEIWMLDIKEKYETLPELKKSYKSSLEYRNILLALGDYFQYCKKDSIRSRIYYSLYADRCGEVFSFQSSEYAGALFMLGAVDRESGQKEQAMTEILQATKILDDIGEGEQLTNILIFYYASALCRETGRTEQAVEYALRIYEVVRQQVHMLFDVMSEFQREGFIGKYGNGTENMISLLPLFCTPQFAGKAYDASLYSKGLLLRSWNRIKESVYASQDQELIGYLHKIDSLKEELQRMSSDFSEQNTQQKNKIAVQLEELDKEMVGRSREYRQAMLQQVVTWQDIQKALPPDKAAIEFVVSDSIYGALVLTARDSFPRYIPLFCIQDLADILNRLEAFGIHEKIRRLYTNGEGCYGAELYRLIWEPLEKQLNGIQIIDYSPVGMLHHLSFAALQPQEGECLEDRYELNLLSSTSEIVVPSGTGAVNDGGKACIYGGIYYDEEWLTQSLAQEYRGAVKKAVGWNYLPQTGREIHEVAEELKRGKIETSLYTGFEASEGRFKSMSGCAPDIIHLATHGFYLVNEKEIKASKYLNEYGGGRYNAMLRSGIILAQANRVWTGGKLAHTDEDGILTADEIAKLNLSGTALAVLSACETGLGDVDIREGVMGLQRAFKQAGVRQLIMSLWQVDDRVTSEIMALFYKYLRENRNVKKAFRLSLADIRKKYLDPFYWGAFVLLD